MHCGGVGGEDNSEIYNKVNLEVHEKELMQTF